MTAEQSRWPALHLADWADTKDTLHLWTQVVGKVRLALAPAANHWWHVPLYVNARGLTTSVMPAGEVSVEVRFDFVDHQLYVETSEGAIERVELAPRSVADFYHATMHALREAGVPVAINTRPVELTEVIRFERDEIHGAYNPEPVERFWKALDSAAWALTEFRGDFLGKCSPVHFWWGSFDLSCTRFSGRAAPPHPGGVPNCPDYVTREAYSHECISAGWWPGGGVVEDAAFYAYAYPEPAGCSAAGIRPAGAAYHPTLREWVLPYDAVRASSRPDADVAAFLASTYDVAATLGGWDRPTLERPVAGAA
jgi:hypothetical protein